MKSTHHPQRSIRQDVMSSMVVFLIAMPLSLGIALASGAPPVSAMVAAIIGGLIVGTISGAPLVVTGPAAGLSAMILQYIQSYGINSLFQITVLAGMIQMVMAAFRSARIIQKIPKSVVEGVLSAIGAVIVLGQIFVILGQKIPGAPLKNIAALPHAFAALTSFSQSSVPITALAIGLITIGTVQVWKHYAKKLSWLPAALPGVLVGTLASFAFDIPRMSLSPMGSYIQNAFSNTTNSGFWTSLLQFAIPAFGLAIVASAESLLTARSVDVLTTKRHLKTELNVDKELMAQGFGNLISGSLGGLPMTGVMVRSAANVDAGATSRWSTILHSLWIAVFVFAAPQILNSIPLAALAAILILTGIKLINFGHMIQAVKEHPLQASLWPATMCAVIATDLLKGLGIGLAGAVVMHLATRKKPAHSAPEVSTSINQALGRHPD